MTPSRRTLGLAALGALAAPAPAFAVKAPVGPARWTRTMWRMRWLDRRYRVYVATPKGPPSVAGWPVFYATDANGMFDILAQTAEVQAFYESYSGTKPGVMVGIDHDSPRLYDDQRAYNLSPPDPSVPDGRRHHDASRSEKLAGTGGADKLLDFIVQELDPRLRAMLPLDPDRRAVYGHSRGGLFVLHALFTRPQAFTHYIAASPSIPWRGGFVKGEEKRFVAGPGPRDRRLLINVAERENPELIGEAAAMAGRLEGVLPVTYTIFPNENHVSVIPASVGEAVRWFLTPPGRT